MAGVADPKMTGQADNATHHGNVASVISKSLLLLVRRIMLLVDDDKSQVREGRKNS